MRKASYLVVWWMAQEPHAAVFESQIAAEAAASVRNALMVSVSGEDVQIDSVLDWYRRDSDGHPMPAEWRDVLGQVRVPSPSKKAPEGEPAGHFPLVTTGTTPEPRMTKARGV